MLQCTWIHGESALRETGKKLHVAGPRHQMNQTLMAMIGPFSLSRREYGGSMRLRRGSFGLWGVNTVTLH